MVNYVVEVKMEYLKPALLPFLIDLRLVSSFKATSLIGLSRILLTMFLLENLKF